jgi:hypothetical protein
MYFRRVPEQGVHVPGENEHHGDHSGQNATPATDEYPDKPDLLTNDNANRVPEQEEKVRRESGK